jgi:hypothetical protein
MFVEIKCGITLNDIRGHLIHLMYASTQMDASVIRNIHNPTRFGLTTMVMLTLHRRRKGGRLSGLGGGREQ